MTTQVVVDCSYLPHITAALLSALSHPFRDSLSEAVDQHIEIETVAHNHFPALSSHWTSPLTHTRKPGATSTMHPGPTVFRATASNAGTTLFG